MTNRSKLEVGKVGTLGYLYLSGYFYFLASTKPWTL